MIRALYDAGADVFRLNFSHGAHEDHRARMTLIREIERDVGRPIAVLGDLQGPKLRIGTFAKGPVDLQRGQSLSGSISIPRRAISIAYNCRIRKFSPPLVPAASCCWMTAR